MYVCVCVFRLFRGAYPPGSTGGVSCGDDGARRASRDQFGQQRALLVCPTAQNPSAAHFLFALIRVWLGSGSASSSVHCGFEHFTGIHGQWQFSLENVCVCGGGGVVQTRKER